MRGTVRARPGSSCHRPSPGPQVPARRGRGARVMAEPLPAAPRSGAATSRGPEQELPAGGQGAQRAGCSTRTSLGHGEVPGHRQAAGEPAPMRGLRDGWRLSSRARTPGDPPVIQRPAQPAPLQPLLTHGCFQAGAAPPAVLPRAACPARPCRWVVPNDPWGRMGAGDSWHPRDGSVSPAESSLCCSHFSMVLLCSLLEAS